MLLNNTNKYFNNSNTITTNKNGRDYSNFIIDTDIARLYPDFITTISHPTMKEIINDKFGITSNLVNNDIESFKITGKEQNVVIVKFKDGDTQKAVCMPDDEFNLEIALIICIAKHSCKGSSNLYKLIKQTINSHYFEEYNKALKEKEIYDNKLKEIENAKKRKEYLINKRKRESEQRIEEMKIAILRAKQEGLTIHCEEGDND